jgi:hypothetical protein
MLTIHWSEPAKFDYWKNIEYLEREWTLKEVYNFIDKTNELIDLFEKGNVIFKPSNYKSTYQVPVVKQITLYYSVINNKVELLRFWNNHQDLAKFSL